MLTLERLREVLSYDPETGVWIWLIAPNNRIKAGTVLAGSIYRQVQVDGVVYQSSHLAWFYMTGDWPPTEVDHRDLDPSNDRWENLRLATLSQNKANRRVSSRNILGIKGVSPNPRSKKNPFTACISVNGVDTYLGCFPTARAASEAYLAAAQAAFGEFARAS